MSLKGNPWDVTTRNLYNMTDDEHLFRSKLELEEEGWQLNGNVFELEGKRMLPLYEAKMVDFYNHRAADVILSETAVIRKNQPRYHLTTSFVTQTGLHCRCIGFLSLTFRQGKSIGEDGRHSTRVLAPGWQR